MRLQIQLSGQRGGRGGSIGVCPNGATSRNGRSVVEVDAYMDRSCEFGFNFAGSVEVEAAPLGFSLAESPPGTV